MKARLMEWLTALAVTAVLSAAVAPPANAIVLPVPPRYTERIDGLLEAQKNLKKDLQTVREQLDPETLGTEEGVNANHAVNNLFNLMDQLARNRKAIEDLKKELDQLFMSPPPLKLARISGPKPASWAQSSARRYTEEIDYRPNSAGYTRRLRNYPKGELVSSTGIAVTYAPLEIVPGEPFHFEIEARQAAFLDSPSKCTRDGRERMGVNVHASMDARVHARQDLRCQPAAVKMSVRMKPVSPVFIDHPTIAKDQWWKFPYLGEIGTSGDIVVRPRGEDVVFRLRARKDKVTLGDRNSYRLDVEIKPVRNKIISGPGITLHYRSQEESIGFLPAYQFPEDTSTFLISVPDIKGLSRKKAIETLTRRRLDAKISIGQSPEREELAGKVAEQDPAPGKRLEAHSSVNLTLYSNYAAAFKVPDVTGLSRRKALEELAKIPLAHDVRIGSPPHTPDLAGKVAKQDPPPGAKVKKQAVVKLTLYANYASSRTVPDLAGRNYKQARRTLYQLDLPLKRRDGGAPRTRNLAGKAKKQSPAPGTEVSKGTPVKVWFYGEYRPTREEQLADKDCSMYRGSTAVWDQTAGKPVCTCPRGLVWARNRTHCEKSIPPSQICADNYPGSIARGRTSEGKINCECPDGYAWAKGKTHCRKFIPPSQICADNYPGSIARGRTSEGKINCECPDGYAWAKGKTHCVKKIPPQEIKPRKKQCYVWCTDSGSCSRVPPGDSSSACSIAWWKEYGSSIRSMRHCPCQHSQSESQGEYRQPGSQVRKCPPGYYLGNDGSCAKTGGGLFGQ